MRATKVDGTKTDARTQWELGTSRPVRQKKTYKHHTNTAGVGCLAERLLGDWAGQKNYGGNFSFLILGIDRDSKLNVSSYHRYKHEQLVVQSLCND